MPDKLTPEELAERHRRAIERDRASCRSPLTPEEHAGAEALGGYLRELRLAAGLSVDRAASLGEMSHDGWRRIERATRRTRHSTVKRIADGLARHLEMDPNDLYSEMVKRADNALAPESQYWERVEKRRKLRVEKNAAKAARVQTQAENWRQVKDDIAAFERCRNDRTTEMYGPIADPVIGRIRF